MRRTQESPGRALGSALLLLVLAAGLGGCNAVERLADKVNPLTSAPDPDKLTQDELSHQLAVYADYFAQVVQTAARTIREDTDDPALQRATMVWGLISVKTVRTSLLADDPQLGFLDVWVFCAQLRDFFETGEGSKLFGEHHQIAVGAITDLEGRIEEIGTQFLDSEQLANSRDEVESFAAAHPLSGEFARSAALPSTSAPEELGALRAVLDVPMSPFRVFSGIDEGAAAVTRFSLVTERFAQRFESLPEETLWEVDLMLHDLEQRGVVLDLRRDFASFVESSSRLASSAESFSETAKTLPDDLREDMEQLIERVNAEQAELQKTIDATRQAIEEARTLTTSIDQVVNDVNGSSDSLRAASDGVAAAGESWKATIEAYHAMAAELYPPQDEPDPTDEKPPFDINEYTASAEAIGAAAEELRLGINELRTLLGGEELRAGAGEVEETVRASAEAAAEPARELVDHSAWRALQVAVAIFFLALAYRVISNRWLTRRDSRDPRPPPQ